MWSQSWYTHQLREDLKSSHHYWLWCTRHANLDTATNNERERRKQLMSEGGVAWERKRGGGMLSYSSFLRRTKGRENDEGISCCPLPAGWLCFFLPLFHFPNFILYLSLSSFPFPSAPLFLCLFCFDNLSVQSLHISPFHFGSALFTHDVWVWQFSLLVLAMGRKPWFLHTLSFSVLTKHWLFMTENSQILSCLSASIPVFLCVSHFHAFSSSSLSVRLPSRFSLPLLLSLLRAAPAVWEQIALLLLGLGAWTGPWSHLWERGRASLAYATTMC